jgi:hypothetical protein
MLIKKNGTDQLLAKRKKQIQNDFKKKLGLLVDFLSQVLRVVMIGTLLEDLQNIS